jgi:hypothetical protein
MSARTPELSTHHVAQMLDTASIQLAECRARNSLLVEALIQIAQWDDGGGSCQSDIARAALAKVTP